MADLSELDLVNPYLSPLRQWVCTQLANLLPDNTKTLASNNGTKQLFQQWTGHTQASLESAWLGEGFKKQKNGTWTRVGGGAVTTSCNGFVGNLIQRILNAGFKGGQMSVQREPLGTFNLPGCKPPRSGKEPATTVGWHWYRDRTQSVRPRAGDFFQIGTPTGKGQWSFAHVGVITSFWPDDSNPTWTTVEAGQGGPGKGFDFMKRKGPRPLKPIDAQFPNKELMGWLDIDEYFEGWSQQG